MRGSDIDAIHGARRADRRHFILGALGSAVCGFSVPTRAQGGAAAATLLVLGDSLSAEYGLPRGSGWVALLQQRLAAHAPPWQVANASISGETTSGGRSRLGALLAQHKPRLVIIELGGNDALRGLPLAMTQTNLSVMARQARSGGAAVLVVGINVPPNYGRAYSEGLLALFGNVARAERAALVPSLLAGVADAPDAEGLFQSDRIHPTVQAQPRMLGNVWPVLQPLLK
jgi:acyl-CoA thioesterase-1